MTLTTFHFHSTPTGKPKVMTLNAIDVAARYFVYKLYEATDGQPMQWATLRGMDEPRATVARAIERGWSSSSHALPLRAWVANRWNARPR